MSVSFSGKVPDTTTQTILESLNIILQQIANGRQVYYGPFPPPDPSEGDMWYNPITDELYTYVE